MAAWCLLPHLANKFLEAVRSGEINPERLMEMTSEERRALFAEHLGPENAREVNAQFESKMLLKDQKRGMVTWAQRVAGITEAQRRDIVATINRLDRVLQPEEEKAFLADLAAKRLGVTVTADEAREIYQLSQAAEQARTRMVSEGWNPENGVAYGRAVMNLSDRIEELKPNGQTFADKALNVLSFPKTALTSVFHWTAPFVQGWGMMSTKEWWSGVGQMFQYFMDENNFRDLNAYIISHPDYELARDGKLGLTKVGDRLSAREEALQSTLLEGANEWLKDKTGAPNAIRAWSRSFTGFLNYVRFNRFTSLLDAARLAGEDVRVGSQAVRDLAKVVNDFTGRGELALDLTGTAEAARGVEGPAALLNAMFFSPRKLTATMHMFNPIRYANPRISQTARMAAARQLVGSILATGAVLSLARVLGANIDLDPRSSNFAKIQIGEEKLDMTGGNAAYVRLLARMITNQEVTSSGKSIEFGSNPRAPTRGDALKDFLRGKLAPVAGTIADALYGKDMTGQEFSIPREIRDKLMPITINSFVNLFQNDPGNTAAYFPALAGLLGVELETKAPPASKTGMNVWGQPFSQVEQAFGGTPANWSNDPVNKAMDQLGVRHNFPMDTIRGVKLTHAQYDDYVRTSGQLAHMRLEAVIQSPGWDNVPANTRAEVVKETIRKARDMAATSIMLQSQGSSNDILRQATEAKRARLTAPAS